MIECYIARKRAKSSHKKSNIRSLDKNLCGEFVENNLITSLIIEITTKY